VLRSLFSGITGLRQHQTMMDVVGNNIANVNTTGFKASSVVFEDTLSQILRQAGAPANGLGGINPAQVGLGVQLGTIANNFGQGSAQTTGRTTDLMIQGDGFFVVRQGGEDLFTRSGAFSFDSDGRLVNSEGMVVQGWMGTAGALSTDGPVQDIVLPAGSLIPPIPSTSVTVGGNVSPDTPVGGVLTLGVTIYDEGGNGHALVIEMTRSSADTYDVALSENGAAVGTAGSVTFNPDGSIASSTDPTVQLTTSGPTVTVSLTGATRYGGLKSLSVTDADGQAAGSLEQFRIGPDGTVTGVFSNGEKLNLAKLALANFNNPGGLEKIGNTAFRSSTNSGLAQVGSPGSGGRGLLLSSTLEMSNVDLAQEFTNLIIAQRGFQANSRVITTSDEMLQDLVNIKR
jgi:flagellar hook protein FlgE